MIPRASRLRSWPALLLLACGAPAASDDPVADVTLRFVAEGATAGEVTLRDDVDPADVLRGDNPFTLGPVEVPSTVEAVLPAGWLTLVASGELTPHPGCTAAVADDSAPYEDGWEARLDVWVGASDPPTGHPVQVVPGEAGQRLTFELLPKCGCCLD